jgi:hypothetical protein
MPFSNHQISNKEIRPEIKNATIAAIINGNHERNPSEKITYTGPRSVPMASKVQVCFNFLF